jgi:hypothetical protein
MQQTSDEVGPKKDKNNLRQLFSVHVSASAQRLPIFVFALFARDVHSVFGISTVERFFQKVEKQTRRGIFRRFIYILITIPRRLPRVCIYLNYSLAVDTKPLFNFDNWQKVRKRSPILDKYRSVINFC